MNPTFKNYLLEITQSDDAQEVEVIQSLWSGYGKISRYRLFGSDLQTVVVKQISVKQAQHHPRGWNSDFGHLRKLKSYEIETKWYKSWNQQCTQDSRTPKFLACLSQVQHRWIVLEDLDTEFPLRKYDLSLAEVQVCLKWLANFHATFLQREPTGLWQTGTYWHLDTRPDEWEKIEHAKLKSKAKAIDQLLNESSYKTIVHGDAKVANFCFSIDGKQVAAVDFQYVGGGCGMKDVAYFLGSCLSGSDCVRHQDSLLDYYFSELKEALCSYTIADLRDLEEEWRNLYPVACVDFTRFLLGWMPTHGKLNGYQLGMVEKVLKGL